METSLQTVLSEISNCKTQIHKNNQLIVDIITFIFDKKQPIGLQFSYHNYQSINKIICENENLKKKIFENNQKMIELFKDSFEKVKKYEKEIDELNKKINEPNKRIKLN